MNAHHDVHLAQQIVFEITNPACRARGTWWSAQEAKHAKARTRATAEEASAAALALCRRCSFYDECEMWAQLDSYTGLAAGAAYKQGVRRDAGEVTPRGPKPRRSALDIGLEALGDAIEHGRWPLTSRQAG